MCASTTGVIIAIDKREVLIFFGGILSYVARHYKYNISHMDYNVINCICISVPAQLCLFSKITNTVFLLYLFHFNFQFPGWYHGLSILMCLSNVSQKILLATISRWRWLCDSSQSLTFIFKTPGFTGT